MCHGYDNSTDSAISFHRLMRSGKDAPFSPDDLSFTHTELQRRIFIEMEALVHIIESNEDLEIMLDTAAMEFPPILQNIIDRLDFIEALYEELGQSMETEEPELYNLLLMLRTRKENF